MGEHELEGLGDILAEEEDELFKLKEENTKLKQENTELK